MSSFQPENLDHIKNIFQAKTGVELNARRPVHCTIRTMIVLAAVIACFTVTALATSLFSSLNEDALALKAVYEGDGIVSIQVENPSDKELHFQPKLKLMRWTTGVEIQPLSDDIRFDGTKIAPHTSGTMTIDLSKAYDINALETPLTDDWHYLVLTNNSFAFGQDWMCTIEFSEPTATSADVPPSFPVDSEAIQHIGDDLRPYFEGDSFDITQRRELDSAYVGAYTQLLSTADGPIVRSVSPVLPGNRISSEVPHLTVEIPTEESPLPIGINWHSRDTNFKMLATQDEYALVLSVSLPSAKYRDAGTYLPLLYIFTYEKSAISPDSYAFIYGQLMRFQEMESYRVYEDDQYVCYEVSSLIYTDLTEYAQTFVAQNGGLLYDEQVQVDLQTIASFFKENLFDLICYR